MKHSFGSDNHSGVHPEIMEAIVSANQGFSEAYYGDERSGSTLKKIEDLFGGNCQAFFALNGTGANVLALSTLARPTDAILCAETAHINVDECGAPVRFSGATLITLPHRDGKVSPDTVKKHLHGIGDQHHSQPRVLSISQPTELGTLYTTDEIRALADLMHEHQGYLHMDGSRISNAAARMNIGFKEMTADQHVDCVSFGGTKNGMLIGEAVIFFDTVDSSRSRFIRKQMSQLYSKGRFIAAQFDAYLKDGLCLQMASHSNEMAKYLETRLKAFKEIRISRPVDTNAVFACIPEPLYRKLIKKHVFYIWDEETMEVRWMCSFNTTKEDIDCFIEDIKNTI